MQTQVFHHSDLSESYKSFIIEILLLIISSLYQFSFIQYCDETRMKKKISHKFTFLMIMMLMFYMALTLTIVTFNK